MVALNNWHRSQEKRSDVLLALALALVMGAADDTYDTAVLVTARYHRAAAMSDTNRTPQVVGVAVIRPHVMRLLFSDGMVRDVQYVPGKAHGSLIEPIEDPSYFAQVRVDTDAGTVVWPNGLDLAPEVLHGDYAPNETLGFIDVTTKQLA